MNRSIALSQFYLRMALGLGFLFLGLDRFGTWGAAGTRYASWGDWKTFSLYAHQLMYFLPYGLAEALAIAATVSELLFGVLLVTGWKTRLAAVGAGCLTLCFAICMAITFGITSPVNYSVFVVSASGFLLASLPGYSWSVDGFLLRKNKLNQ